MRDFFRFEPLYQQRVWGGRAIESAFGRKLPPGPIGESWEMSDRPDAQSVVKGGRGSGTRLGELLRRSSAEVMGPVWPSDRRFPLLVKWLDCRERLSLQVHPPAEAAAELKGEPKTENWYVAATSPGAHLIAGLKRGVTPAEFERALAEGNLDSCVHRFPVAAGDSILVESGRIHALDAGLLVLEIQQNSDTTYRVFDWGRVGLDGKPRSLHLAEARRSIRWNDFEPAAVRSSPISAVIAECPYFRIRRLLLSPGEKMRYHRREEPRLVSVVAGAIKINGDAVARGENVLVPFVAEIEIQAVDASILLVTDGFARPAPAANPPPAKG